MFGRLLFAKHQYTAAVDPATSGGNAACEQGMGALPWQVAAIGEYEHWLRE